MTVMYHPNEPQDARLDGGLLWLFFVAFGALFILVGLGMYLYGWINRGKNTISPDSGVR